MYFNVNLKFYTKLINSAFVGEFVNCVVFKMHGATIKMYYRSSLRNFAYICFTMGGKRMIIALYRIVLLEL